MSRFDWGGLFAEVGGVAERCAGFWALEGVCAAAATVGEPGAGEYEAIVSVFGCRLSVGRLVRRISKDKMRQDLKRSSRLSFFC